MKINVRIVPRNQGRSSRALTYRERRYVQEALKEFIEVPLEGFLDEIAEEFQSEVLTGSTGVTITRRIWSEWNLTMQIGEDLWELGVDIMFDRPSMKLSVKTFPSKQPLDRVVVDLVVDVSVDTDVLLGVAA